MSDSAIISTTPVGDVEQETKKQDDLSQETVSSVLASLSQKKLEGERWCLISREWFERWSKEYCPTVTEGDNTELNGTNSESQSQPMNVEMTQQHAEEQQTSPHSGSENNQIKEKVNEKQVSKQIEAYKPTITIGPIDNTTLVDVDCLEYELKRNLSEGNEFIAVPEQIFDKLQSYYGGGPKLIRNIVKISNAAVETVELDIYPLTIFVHVCTTDAVDVSYASAYETANVVSETRYKSIGDLYSLWSDSLKTPVEQLRLWVRANSSASDLFNINRETPLELTQEYTDIDSFGWMLLHNSFDVLLNEIIGDIKQPQHEQTPQEHKDSSKIALIVEVGKLLPIYPNKGTVSNLNSKPTEPNKLADLEETILWPRRKQYHLWRYYLQKDDRIDVFDGRNWWESLIVEVNRQPPEAVPKVKIHFRGWGSNFDCVYPIDAFQIQPLYSKVKKWRHTITIGSFLDYCVIHGSMRKWYPCRVCVLGFGAQSGCVTICVKSYDTQLKTLHTIHTDSDLLMPLHTHTKASQSQTVIADLMMVDVSNPSSLTHMLASSSNSSNTTDWGSSLQDKAMTMFYSNPNSRNSSLTSLNFFSDTGITNGRGACEAGVVGLRNLGNTCYANSIMQCLNSIQSLTDNFLSGKYVQSINTANALGTGGVLARAFFNYLQNCWSGKNAVIDNREVLMTILRKNPMFAGGGQHDAQEFLTTFLDLLHEDLNTVRIRPTRYQLNRAHYGTDAQLADAYLIQHIEQNDSYIGRLFNGQFQTNLECGHCSSRWKTNEVYTMLSLAIPRNVREVDLSILLTSFCSRHRLDRDNCVQCESCRQLSPPHTETKLWSVPNVLVIQLKRFFYEHTSLGLRKGKISTPVNYPLDGLDLRPFCAENPDRTSGCIYDLCAVSVQQGSLGGGHYIAYGKHSKTGTWRMFSDTHVRVCNRNEAVNIDAYLLFYQLRQD